MNIKSSESKTDFSEVTMSKQSQHKNQSKKKGAPVKNDKNKKVLIIAAAVLVIALAVAATVIGVKYFRGDFENVNPVTTQEYGEGERKEGEKYSYVEYDGVRMPVEFADILNQAAIDSQKACESQGIALTLGETQFSKPEFRMYYYEQACSQYEKAADTELENGVNRSGFDIALAPSEQKHLQDDFTWQDHFVDNAVDRIKYCTATFEMAKNDGFEFNEQQIDAILSYCDTYKPAEDKMVSFYEENFGPGATYYMYCAKYIRDSYSQVYSTVKSSELESAVTEEEMTKEFEDNRRDYLVAGCRVYPIESKYEKAEVAGIKTEQQFIDFAQKNFTEIYGEGYDLSVRTENKFLSYQTAADVYGGEVADWLYDSKRKVGDIEVVETMLYDYLCYIEVLPFESFSADVFLCEMAYQDLNNAETIKNDQEGLKMLYDKWQKGEATIESLEALTEGTVFTTGDYTARAGEELDRQILYWIFDDARKEGDHGIFNTQEAAYIVYFKSHNKDQQDWKYYSTLYLASVKFDKLLADFVEENFDRERRNDSVINALCAEALPVCQDFSDRYRESIGLKK